MQRLRDWIELQVDRLCRWLDDWFSGGGPMASFGEAICGLEPALVLPVDRRLYPEPLQMAGGRAPGYSYGMSHPDTSCGFWAYCHMRGQPCTRCGGHNFLGSRHHQATAAQLNQACPGNSTLAHYWVGCCGREKHDEGTGRQVAYYDCCQSRWLRTFGTFFDQQPCSDKPGCSGWPQAKNWCLPGQDYKCTIVKELSDTC